MAEDKIFHSPEERHPDDRSPLTVYPGNVTTGASSVRRPYSTSPTAGPLTVSSGATR